MFIYYNSIAQSMQDPHKQTVNPYALFLFICVYKDISSTTFKAAWSVGKCVNNSDRPMFTESHSCS